MSVFDATREFWGRSFDARSNARVSLEFNLAWVREVRGRPHVRARPISTSYYLFIFFIYLIRSFSRLSIREREREGKKKSRSAAGKEKKMEREKSSEHFKVLFFLARFESTKLTIESFFSFEHHRVPKPRVAKPVSATRAPPKPVPPRRDATARLATSTPWASATARRTSTNTPRSTYRKNSRRTATSTKVTCCTGRLRSPVSSVPVRSPSTWLLPCKLAYRRKRKERGKWRRGENFCRTKCFSKQE